MVIIVERVRRGWATRCRCVDRRRVVAVSTWWQQLRRRWITHIVFLLAYTVYTCVCMCVLYSNCYTLNMFRMGLTFTVVVAEMFCSSSFFFFFRCCMCLWRFGSMLIVVIGMCSMLALYCCNKQEYYFSFYIWRCFVCVCVSNKIYIYHGKKMLLLIL